MFTKVSRWLVVSLAGLLAVLTVACGAAAAEPLATPTLAPELEQGRAAFVVHCGACHSTAPDAVIVGPSLAGFSGRAASRVDGLDARTYLYSSILQPGDYVVGGFENLMPEGFGKKMTGEELDAIVEYVLALP